VEEEAKFGHKNYKHYCLKCCGEIIQEAKKELRSVEGSLSFHAKKLKNEV
jgi:hypothetical protein